MRIQRWLMFMPLVTMLGGFMLLFPVFGQGAAATAAFIILDLGGESMTRWTITLVLAIAYMVMGIWGIVNYLKADK